MLVLLNPPPSGELRGQKVLLSKMAAQMKTCVVAELDLDEKYRKLRNKISMLAHDLAMSKISDSLEGMGLATDVDDADMPPIEEEEEEEEEWIGGLGVTGALYFFCLY